MFSIISMVKSLCLFKRSSCRKPSSTTRKLCRKLVLSQKSINQNSKLGWLRMCRLACGPLVWIPFSHRSQQFLGKWDSFGSHRRCKTILVELVDLKSNDVCNRSSCVRRGFPFIHACSFQSTHESWGESVPAPQWRTNGDCRNRRRMRTPKRFWLKTENHEERQQRLSVFLVYVRGDHLSPTRNTICTNLSISILYTISRWWNKFLSLLPLQPLLLLSLLSAGV